MPRLPATQRRQQILAAATTLFAEQGFQGTTTKQIARRAKVNEAILFRHFPSKKDLYWQVIDAKCREITERQPLSNQLAASDDDRVILTAIALDLLDRFSGDTSLLRLLLFSGLESHELSARVFETYIADYYAELAEHVRRRIRKGIFRKVDPLLAVRGFLGMVNHYLIVQELFGGKQHQKFDHQKVAATLTDIWLEGMKQR